MEAETTGLFSNTCPKCAQGKIFKRFLKMNKKCETCGNIFEKEEGYFIGAMIASYFLGIFLVIPVLGLGLFTFQLSIPASIGLAVLQMLLLQPFLFHYSRTIWIQLEHRVSIRK